MILNLEKREIAEVISQLVNADEILLVTRTTTNHDISDITITIIGTNPMTVEMEALRSRINLWALTIEKNQNITHKKDQ